MAERLSRLRYKEGLASYFISCLIADRTMLENEITAHACKRPAYRHHGPIDQGAGRRLEGGQRNDDQRRSTASKNQLTGINTEFCPACGAIPRRPRPHRPATIDASAGGAKTEAAPIRCKSARRRSQLPRRRGGSLRKPTCPPAPSTPRPGTSGMARSSCKKHSRAIEVNPTRRLRRESCAGKFQRAPWDRWKRSPCSSPWRRFSLPRVIKAPKGDGLWLPHVFRRRSMAARMKIKSCSLVFNFTSRI